MQHIQEKGHSEDEDGDGEQTRKATGNASPARTEGLKGKRSRTWGKSFAKRAQPDELEDSVTFRISTQPGGHNSGREYTFRANTAEAALEWVYILRDLSKQAKASKIKEQTSFQQLQIKAKSLYFNQWFQNFFGVLIMSSFLLAIIVNEIRPAYGSPLDHFFFIIDDVFTGLFTAELIVALVSHWFYEILHEPWILFDIVVVGSSLVSAAFEGLPALYPLRAVRALRAVKLLQKLGSLRIIVKAMMHSVVPVANAILLLALVTMIYATLAVNFFGGKICGTSDEDHRRAETKEAIAATCEDPVNPYFSKFSVSLLSMFQVSNSPWNCLRLLPLNRF